MTSATFIRHFARISDAESHMRAANRAAKKAGCRDLLVVIDGPDSGATACDLATAIEADMPYRWES